MGKYRNLVEKLCYFGVAVCLICISAIAIAVAIFAVSMILK